MTGIAIFIVGLIVLVTIHELGHLIVARRTGMHCSKFFVGFGPTLWSRKDKHGMEYGIKAILLGGYVKIDGMTRKEADAMPENIRHRAFVDASPAARLATVAAGPLVNVAAGVALFAMVALLWGTATTNGRIVDVAAGSVAAEAGLVAGDEYQNRTQDENAIYIDVPGKGSLVIPSTDGTMKSTGADIEAYRSRAPGDVAGFTWMATSKTVGAIFTMLGELPQQIMAAFSPDRGSGGAMSVVGAAAVTGQMFGSGDTAAGWQSLLLIFASLNLSLAVLNMLPLLPFDGGHAMLATIDLVRQKWAALLRKAKPAPIDPERLVWVTASVIALVLVMSVSLLIADILNPPVL